MGGGICSLKVSMFYISAAHKISSIITGAHEGPVFSLAYLDDGIIISTGGKDRQIKDWKLEDKELIKEQMVRYFFHILTSVGGMQRLAQKLAL